MVATFGVDSGSEEDPEALADAQFFIWAEAGTIYALDSSSSLYQLGPFECTIMTSTGPQTGTGTDFRQFTNATISPPPNNTAILVQKRTSRGGRKGRGRMYLPPASLHEPNVGATGDITGVTLTAHQTWADEVLAAMDLASQPMVLLHSEEAGAIAPDPVTSLSVQPKVATQRTRLRR